MLFYIINLGTLKRGHYPFKLTVEPTLAMKHAPSVESTLDQVVLDDDISDCIKDELHVLGIGGTGKVGVYLLGILSSV